MHWPWMSRAVYDLSQQHHTQTLAAAHATIRSLQEVVADHARRLGDLTAHIVTLTAPRSAQPSPAPDPVLSAMIDACGNDPWLREQMGRQVMQDRANGVKDEEIVARIHAGTTADSVTFG